jgi:sugar/nucleoside kinase (ribokinase family)
MPIIGIDGGFSRDHLVNTEQGARFDVPGGPGTYASLASQVTLRWLEDALDSSGRPASQVRLFGEGADQNILDLLTGAGVDTTWMPEPVNTPSLWILTSPSGRRIVRADRNGQYELGGDIDDYGAELATPATFTHGLDVLLRCAPRTPGGVAPDTHTLVAVDPDQREIAARGWAYIEELAETTTLFLPSRVQLSQLGSDPLEAARAIRDRTGRAVVARLDAGGAFVLTNTGEDWHVASVPTEVTDTTGAGDSHAAALVTALVCKEGKNDLVLCTAIASVIGSLVVGGWGPESLLNTDTTDLGNIEDVLKHVTTTRQM